MAGPGFSIVLEWPETIQGPALKLQAVTGLMILPTEPIGSIPRPRELIAAVERVSSWHPSMVPLYEDAVRDTVARFEATGSPVISDGEHRKYYNFWTYSVHGLPNTAPDG